jgi:hypothetical protein
MPQFGRTTQLHFVSREAGVSSAAASSDPAPQADSQRAEPKARGGSPSLTGPLYCVLFRRLLTGDVRLVGRGLIKAQP